MGCGISHGNRDVEARRRHSFKSFVRTIFLRLTSTSGGGGLSNSRMPLSELVDQRAGHIAVTYLDTVLVWGGYSETKKSSTDYWDPSVVLMYQPLLRTWRSLETRGHIPKSTCGATAVVYDNDMYVLMGFQRYTDEDLGYRIEANTNDIYVLNITSLTWKKAEPRASTVEPLKADKLTSWIDTDRQKIYLFGGFGPAHEQQQKLLPKHVTFTIDESTVGYVTPVERGWNNQLVVYDIRKNEWQWPKCYGDIPSARAACGSVWTGHEAYLFGGRYENDRLNDLYRAFVDRDSGDVCWSRIQPSFPIDSLSDSFPCGRSWHTLTMMDAGRALLYGGYDSYCDPLGDAWVLDTSPKGGQLWTRLSHFQRGCRLWHSAVYLKATSEVLVIGGVVDDLLNRPAHTVRHADTVLRLSTSPLPLYVACLEVVEDNYSTLEGQIDQLPQPLPRHIRSRHEVANLH